MGNRQGVSEGLKFYIYYPIDIKRYEDNKVRLLKGKSTNDEFLLSESILVEDRSFVDDKDSFFCINHENLIKLKKEINKILLIIKRKNNQGE